MVDVSTDIREGDCREVMGDMEDNSVHAIVTDPPYGLEFMDRDWDDLTDWRTGGDFSSPGIGERETDWPSFGGGDTANATCSNCGGRERGENECECDDPDFKVKGRDAAESRAQKRTQQATAQVNWHRRWMEQAFDVLKPGGHMLVFGGNRTHHYVMMAAEFAGFEVRDTITWHYGTGYPKGTNVGKDIDKRKDADREVVDTKTFTQGGGNALNMREGEKREVEHEYTEPATEEAEKWDGWNSTLKPSTEFVLVARKPMSEGTVAENILEHGTGAFNVDACRIPAEDKQDFPEGDYGDRGMYGSPGERKSDTEEKGRHPPNAIFDAENAAILDARNPETSSPSGYSVRQASENRAMSGPNTERVGKNGHGDSGGVSRYFYCSKASKAERTLDGAVDNDHPTVKPVDLMEWLVQLVTAEEQRVLDPFVGSGTTLMATWNMARDGVGIERESKHAETARERVEANKTNRTVAGSKPTHDHSSALDW
jgi:site-specific DNA-methyltransferase (adenine-specific)